VTSAALRPRRVHRRRLDRVAPPDGDVPVEDLLEDLGAGHQPFAVDHGPLEEPSSQLTRARRGLCARRPGSPAAPLSPGRVDQVQCRGNGHHGWSIAHT